MDYTQAQDAYNLALKEYEAAMNKSPTIYAKPVFGMNGGTYVMQSYYDRNGGGSFYDPNALSRLNDARAALEQAKSAQVGALNQRYDRYTQQARDALYQGMKSYQPQALLSPSGNQYDVPQGNLSMYSNRIKSLLGG